jgi:hypothetical protein
MHWRNPVTAPRRFSVLLCLQTGRRLALSLTSDDGLMRCPQIGSGLRAWSSRKGVACEPIGFATDPLLMRAKTSKE